MQLDDALRQLESQAVPGARGDLRALRAVILVEDLVALVLADADALIDDADLHLFVGQPFSAHGDSAPGTAVFDGVIDQVVDGDAEEILVEAGGTELRRSL